MKSPLKWVGGKRWQLEHARVAFDQCGLRADLRLVELFCGGASVSFGLAPRRAHLNDANRYLANFYAWLKKGLLVEPLAVDDEPSYYFARDRFNVLIASREYLDSEEMARLFYYMNRRGFNGLCRFNKSGAFNVPYGGDRTTESYETDLSKYVKPLAEWTTSCGDFSHVVVEPTDFVYADPPYDETFTNYVAGGFGWSDQIRVAEMLAAHAGPAVLVNSATDRIVELYRDLGFDVSTVAAPRSVSCDGDRSTALEVIATRNMVNPLTVDPGLF